MRKRWLLIAAALVAAALFATQCAPGIIEDMQRRQGLAHADALMEEGEYEEAHDALMTWFTRGENTDADYARYYLCNAHIAYERGDVYKRQSIEASPPGRVTSPACRSPR